VSEPVIEVAGINKAFSGNRVLNNIDLAVHSGEVVCLCGENGCGKSSLIKIISGVYSSDAGSISIKGVNYPSLTAPQSINAGIQVIYQDFSVFRNLTVAENISLSYRVQKKKWFINYDFNRALARKALALIGANLDADEEIERLSVAEKQLVAIARAIVQDASLVIMDEPTTAITQKEIEKLFAVIRGLKEKGIAVMFVSHKLDEIAAICDRIVIMRNGKKVVDSPVADFETERIAYYMTGQEVSETPFEYIPAGGRPMLEVENAARSGEFESVSFSVKPGEILAITGQLGSGRTELAKSLFGLAPIQSGKIKIEGRETRIASIKDAFANGIAYLPEDRLGEGLFLNRSLGENFSSAIIDSMAGPLGLIREKRFEELSARWMEELNMSRKPYTTPASDYSGGNQQRIVLGKWLAARPRIFILNCPTVGVDVKSKSEIHEIMKRLARQGLSIIMISDDIGEIISTSNRVVIMNAGRVTLEAETNGITADEISRRILADAPRHGETE
jgi:simple sugar transport system ATP-binding protein